jgi:hypothetical protein
MSRRDTSLLPLILSLHTTHKRRLIDHTLLQQMRTFGCSSQPAPEPFQRILRRLLNLQRRLVRARDKVDVFGLDELRRRVRLLNEQRNGNLHVCGLRTYNRRGGRRRALEEDIRSRNSTWTCNTRQTDSRKIQPVPMMVQKDGPSVEEDDDRADGQTVPCEVGLERGAEREAAPVDALHDAALVVADEGDEDAALLYIRSSAG